VALTIVDLLRDSEIGYFDAPLVIDKDVGAFDVPMYDISFMQVIQTFQDLTNEVLYQSFFKCTIVAKKSSDRSAWNIFQEDVEILVVYR
jgi:hypothetical protein